jgi:toxin ParE1/3/4
VPTVIKQPEAERDIERIALYLLENGAGYDVTDRFVSDLHERFDAHARQPMMGNLCEDLGPDLRCFSFRRNYVVIYRPLDDGIDVLRVFHTARDYGWLFRDEGR